MEKSQILSLVGILPVLWSCMPLSRNAWGQGTQLSFPVLQWKQRPKDKLGCDPGSKTAGITKLHGVSWFPRERFPSCQTSLSSRAQCYLPKANVPVYFRPQRRPNWVWATQSHFSVLLSHYAVPSWHLGLGPSTYALVIKELTYPNSHNLNASWSGSRGQMWKRVLTHKFRRSQVINVQPCLSLVTST